MRKVLLVAVLGAVAMVAPGARATTSANSYGYLYGNSYGPSGIMDFNVATSHDYVSNTDNGYGWVDFTIGSNSGSGSGGLTVSFVPGVGIAKISGTTLSNSNGPITVDITFVNGSVNTFAPPFAYVGVYPATGTTYGGAGTQSNGSITGTVTTQFGTIDVAGVAGGGSGVSAGMY